MVIEEIICIYRNYKKNLSGNIIQSIENCKDFYAKKVTKRPSEAFPLVKLSKAALRHGDFDSFAQLNALQLNKLRLPKITETLIACNPALLNEHM